MYYGEHLMFAIGHGIMCIMAGVLLCIHGIIPAFFPRIGSRLVMRLNRSFTRHREHQNNEIHTITKNSISNN